MDREVAPQSGMPTLGPHQKAKIGFALAQGDRSTIEY
jgi:hypothetical protein